MASIGRVYREKFHRKLDQFNGDMPLPQYLRTLAGDKKHIRIAELGAGPICTIGKESDIEVEIVASDILAEEYERELWSTTDQKPVVVISVEDMEKLSYSNESFDIVHCVNALDHTPDAAKAIAEMKRICKQGGYIYLRHAYDQKARYGGHHCWNAGMEDTEIALFDNGKEQIYLREFISKEELLAGEYLIVSIWKKI